MKRALIAGRTGQDDFNLAELLLGKGYEIHGIKRHESRFAGNQVDISYQAVHVTYPRFNSYYTALTNAATSVQQVREIQPSEIYNLGFISSMTTSFKTPDHTAEVNELATLRLSEAVCTAGLAQKARFYQTFPQTNSKLPRHSTLAKSISWPVWTSTKLSSYDILVNYWTTRSIYACNDRVFNRELPPRGEALVARKITQGAGRIALGLQGQAILYLAVLTVRCNWGYAQYYGETTWRRLQQDKPTDFALTTGITTSVRKFARLAFFQPSINIVFQGEGAQEVGYTAACHNPAFSLMPGQTIVAANFIYYRSSSVESSLADASKAWRQLGWKLRHDLSALARELFKHDLELFRSCPHLTKAGYQALLYTHSA